MKILSYTIYSFFLALLLGVAALFLATLLPIPGNIEVKIVKSGSMEPAIMTGAVVVVKPMDVYAVGDVITFGEDSKSKIPTTHRIASIREEGGKTYFTTKGDANEEADVQEVLKSDVAGKVVLDVPYAGFVLDFARQPIGFSLLIGLPAALIVFDEAAAIWNELRKMRKPKRTKVVARTSDKTPTRELVRPEARRVVGAMDIRPATERRLYLVEAGRERKWSTMMPALIAAVAIPMLSFMHIGSTVSYITDVERSENNLMQARADFSIGQIVMIDTFSLLATPEGEVLGDETEEEPEGDGTTEILVPKPEEPEVPAEETPADPPAEGVGAPVIIEVVPEPEEPEVEESESEEPEVEEPEAEAPEENPETPAE